MIYDHKKNGFTLIEMLFVVIILGILMSISGYLFIATDNSKYYAETCANNIYSTLKNHQYDALVGKKIEGATPDRYNININTDSNIIELGYSTGQNNTITYQTINLANANTQWLCTRQGAYKVILSGDFNSTVAISFARNLTIGSQGPVTIYKDNTNKSHRSTLTVIQEELATGTQKDIAQIEIDTRNQNITYHTCFIFDRATGTCTQRQQ